LGKYYYLMSARGENIRERLGRGIARGVQIKRKMNGNYKRQTRGEENAHTHPGVSSSHQ
jgi:hypothetical protein